MDGNPKRQGPLLHKTWLTPLTLTARRSSPTMAKGMDYLMVRIRLALAGGAVALATGGALISQTVPAGRPLYEAQCANCHGGDGQGGVLGPAIVTRIQARGDAQIAAVIREGISSNGMPAFQFSPEQISELVSYLRTLRPRRTREVQRKQVALTDGRTIAGVVIGESTQELNLRTGDHRIY